MIRIRTKAIGIMAGCLVLVLILGFFASQFILQSYLSLEDKTVRQNVNRALIALQDDIDNLDRFTAAYAWSDNTYNFVQTDSDQYIASNLQVATFLQARINAVVITNSVNQIVYSNEFQFQYGEEIPLPGEFNASLLVGVSIQGYAKTLGLLMNESLQAGMSGLVMLPEGAMLVSIRHILMSNQTGPIDGNFLMGRYLDSLELEKLEQTTNLALSLHRTDDPAIPSILSFNQVVNGTRILTKPFDSKTIDGYAILDDITGHPILVLQVTMPRDIYNAGIVTVQDIMASLFLSGTLFGGISIAIMERTIFSRMSKLEADVSHIGSRGNFSSHVSLAGDDEITRLAGLINKMLLSLEESEKQLREAKTLAAIGATAAMVGHDLRNPLQAITNAAFLLRTLENNLSEDGKKVLNIVEEAIQRADKIIRDLVEYSTNVHLEPSNSDAKSLIDESLASIKIPENIHVLNQTSAQPKIEVDVVKMRRVFLNLLQNAVDAMPNGGTLTIRNTESDDKLQLSISDTGEGIRDEILPQIWDPLFTTKAKGMGYGLAIVKRFVEAHGGSVSVETQAGNGSTFIVSLPINRTTNTLNKARMEDPLAMIQT